MNMERRESFTPKEWEGSKELPALPWIKCEIIALIAFMLATAICAYLVITTELGMKIFLAAIQGIVLGIAIATFFNLATRR
ncbi:hypothetical protein [Erwinia persicina]|uniref:hypothetical protein n=1 Tax=Erwinia persicina TaxID=55211 RepID=UPI0017875EB1|nr:hypothetical protein [Erwinia persicina]MBD8163299.1 hypothetical protein [Erwinia persicina]